MHDTPPSSSAAAPVLVRAHSGAQSSATQSLAGSSEAARPGARGCFFFAHVANCEMQDVAPTPSVKKPAGHGRQLSVPAEAA